MKNKQFYFWQEAKSKIVNYLNPLFCKLKTEKKYSNVLQQMFIL